MPANWTSIVFGALIFAFLFFVTVRGDLAKLLGIFGLAAGTTTPTIGTGSAGSSGTNFPFSSSALVPTIGGNGFGQLGSIVA